MQFQAHKVVFTVTQMGDLACRHMSISVSGGLYPHPVIIYTICTLLGFTGGKYENGITAGPGEDWSILNMHTPRKCAIVAQEFDAA